MGKPEFWVREPAFDQFFGGNPVYRHDRTGEIMVDRGVPEGLKSSLREALSACVAMHDGLARFPTIRLRAIKREIEALLALHLRPIPHFDAWIDPLRPNVVQIRIQGWK